MYKQKIQAPSVIITNTNFTTELSPKGWFHTKFKIHRKHTSLLSVSGVSRNYITKAHFFGHFNAFLIPTDWLLPALFCNITAACNHTSVPVSTVIKPLTMHRVQNLGSVLHNQPRQNNFEILNFTYSHISEVTGQDRRDIRLPTSSWFFFCLSSRPHYL
jgi:hypothetical protein